MAGKCFHAGERKAGRGLPCNTKLRRHERITQQYEYKEVIRKGTVLAGRRFKSYLLIGGESRRKAGFIAGRGVGGATQRNRARRLLREAYRQLKPHTAPLGFKIVFVAGPGIAGAAARDVHNDMKSVFLSCDLLTDERRGE